MYKPDHLSVIAGSKLRGPAPFFEIVQEIGVFVVEDVGLLLVWRLDEPRHVEAGAM